MSTEPDLQQTVESLIDDLDALKKDLAEFKEEINHKIGATIERLHNLENWASSSDED